MNHRHSIEMIFQKLMQGYTKKNLNHISSVIIEAYRRKDFHFLNELTLSIREYMPVQQDQISKLFSRLMMLYHPDRLEVYRKAMTELFNEGDAASLNRYAHVFVMLEKIKQKPFNKHEAKEQTESHTRGSKRHRSADPDDDILTGEADDFISALKQKEYGNLDVVYHKQDLANTEGEIELSGYHIRDLSGLELCIPREIL